MSDTVLRVTTTRLLGADYRSFLTDEFWNTLKQTTKRKTIDAMGYLLYGYANKEDLVHLTKINAADVPGRGLAIYINWIRYVLYGSPDDPGMPTDPPLPPDDM